MKKTTAILLTIFLALTAALFAQNPPGGYGPGQGGGTPGGTNGQVQYNNNGAFGGASNITTNGAATMQFGTPGFNVGTLNVNATGGTTFPTGAAVNISSNFSTPSGIAWGSSASSSILGVSSATAPPTFKIQAHNPHPLQEMEVGTCTMTAAATCTFAIGAAFNSTPLAFASDQAHVTTDTCSVSSTTVTITASASNSTAHNCALVGNPD